MPINLECYINQSIDPKTCTKESNQLIMNDREDSIDNNLQA